MIRKFTSLLISLILCFSLFAGLVSADGDVSGTESFVNGLYETTLGRQADPSGLQAWVSALENRKTTGAAAAFGFVFGEEFRSHNASDAEFVDTLYRALLGREADAAGREGWVRELAGGLSREEMFAGFVNTPEFFEHCSSCGIVPGSSIAGMDINTVANTDLFIERLYRTTLGRSADRLGMYNWTYSIVTGANSGALAAYGFFFSDEYNSHGRSSSEFISDLYNAMLNRAPDEAGLQSWLDLLDGGYSRELIFSGFVYSQEFTSLCESYGIARGDYAASGWCYAGGDRIYIRDGARLTGWQSIDGGYYFFDRRTGALATNTVVNEIPVDGNGRAEDTQYAREKIPVMIKAREIYLTICNPSMSVYEQQMALSNYVMGFPYLMKDYLVWRYADNWACLTAHYANNILNAYGDQLVLGGECVAEACALAYLFNEIDGGQVYLNRDAMHGWVEMNGMYWDPLFAESRGRHYLNMDPGNYEYQVPPFQYVI